MDLKPWDDIKVGETFADPTRWVAETAKLFVWRSGDLKSLNSAFEAFEKADNSTTRANLKTAYETWARKNDSEVKKIRKSDEKLLKDFKEFILAL